MPNAKDYKGQHKNYLVYGPSGSGKSTALLTYPGPKFVYIFDPSGLESFAGHDIEYEMFVPELITKSGPLSKGGSAAKIIKPDPLTFEKFEEDFQERITSGYFQKRGGIIAFESATTLVELLVWYILEKQGRGNAAPIRQDYYYRADAFSKLMRGALAQQCEVFCSAHVETIQDEATRIISQQLALPGALAGRIPLLFSEVIPFHAETNIKDGKVTHYAHFTPTIKIPTVRTTLKGMSPQEDVTINWRKPLEGQGFFNLYKRKEAIYKTQEEIAQENKQRGFNVTQRNTSVKE